MSIKSYRLLNALPIIGKILSARHLYIFGSKVFVLNKHPLSKFEARAHKGIFLGSSETSKAYRIWNPRKQQIEIARDVKILDYPYFTFLKNEDYELVQEDDNTQLDTIDEINVSIKLKTVRDEIQDDEMQRIGNNEDNVSDDEDSDQRRG